MNSLIINDRYDHYHHTYLKSDHWKAIKAFMLSRFPRCQICGSKIKLDVHHRKYRLLYDVRPSDLIVLCRFHHSAIHKPNNLGEKPTLKIVEDRLRNLLPDVKETPRRAYLLVAIRFFKAAHRIESETGIPLQIKARKAMKLPDEKTFSDLLFNTCSKPVRIEKRKLSAPELECRLMRKRYTKAVWRLFQIARKIRESTGINHVPRIRKFLSKKLA